jgi:hypothetical protein
MVRVAKGDVGVAEATAGPPIFDQVYHIKTYSALADLYPRRESGVVENEAWKRILKIIIQLIYETFRLSERKVARDVSARVSEWQDDY